MKNDYRIGGFVTSIFAGVLTANTALAHEAGQANDGYVDDSTGHYITHSTGECVRTGHWEPEHLTVDCGLEPVAKKAPPAPPPPAEPVYETFTLAAKALFDHDKYVVKPEGRASVDELIRRIKEKGANVVDIDVTGHTDSDGTDEYNMALGLRRATAVKNYMVSQGLDASIIDVASRGEREPVVSNATREGRAQNRRVEISIGVKRQTN